MNCPKCEQSELNTATYAGIEVDRCPSCEGIFFDQDEMEKLLASGAAHGADTPEYTEISDQQDMKTGNCARCNVEMVPYLGPANLRIDRCPQCSAVFLDQGELAELLATK